MAENSGIQWTTHTFNPWVGCQRVSPGCQHCYAEAYDKRVGGAKLADGTKSLRWGPEAPRVRTSEALWRKPFAWNRAAREAGERHRVFCASLADVFEDRPELVEWRLELFKIIRATPHLDWQLLTKRPENLGRMLPWGDGRGPLWTNVWLGTTVEDQQRADERIPYLIDQPAIIRFLSMEPLLEQVDFNRCKAWNPVSDDLFLAGIDWIIVGGESGGGARPFNLEWCRSVIGQARTASVPVFVKQMGSRPGQSLESAMVAAPVILDDSHGGDPSEWPQDLRIREFPNPFGPTVHLRNAVAEARKGAS